jgi:hypothetical protein
MFGSQYYPEGQFKPERGGGNNWHVWCTTGAQQVLDTKEYEEWLKQHPEHSYTVNFANGSAARIHPEHPLWKKLVEIAGTYDVEVFPLTGKDEYVPWSGQSTDYRDFDAFAIKLRLAVENQD